MIDHYIKKLNNNYNGFNFCLGFYFLFPTIENMIDTPRGKETYPLTSTFRFNHSQGLLW